MGKKAEEKLKKKKKLEKQRKKREKEMNKTPEERKREKALADFRTANGLDNFDPNNLKPGTVVALQELKKRKKLNNKLGLVTGLFVAAKKRYPIKVYEGNQMVQVLFKNLSIVEPPLKIGTRIALKGFRKNPAYNGLKGHIMNIKEGFKYDVKMDNDKIRANVHRKKLRFLWGMEKKEEKQKREAQEEKKKQF